MEQINTHKSNGLNEALDIFAVDDPGAGGASHLYRIAHGGRTLAEFRFQSGGIQEVGVNGVSNEALLSIVIHRLMGFKSGNFNCQENEHALSHAMDCLGWLKSRTEDRVKRGVEGVMKK